MPHDGRHVVHRVVVACAAVPPLGCCTYARIDGQHLFLVRPLIVAVCGNMHAMCALSARLIRVIREGNIYDG